MRLNGKTIAVLGCGPDVIFPKENKELYRRIIDTGGVIVSEYSSKTKTSADNFRQRNRIVSGMSRGILIVEAREKSGTGITAEFARSQGKTIYCIPSSIENRRGIGNNNQIRKGAKLVLSPNDILEEFGKNETEQLSIEDLDKKCDNKKLELIDMKDDYREIYKILSEPMSVNEISEKTKLDITEVYSRLFMMEMEGLVKKEESTYKKRLTIKTIYFRED